MPCYGVIVEASKFVLVTPSKTEFSVEPYSFFVLLWKVISIKFVSLDT